ncbi:MAG: 4-hydroxy-tetrahydrodipicolinate reductase [Candidatus Kapabacteria bacterium]|nr:4-hydroxy-tetrahydrodipicolinate reductase [Candidatus Kapabacteria bacterium]
MRIALIGYGAMGREIERIAVERGHSIAHRFDIDNPLPDLLTNTDVAIDFSNAQHVVRNVRVCMESGVDMVIGTTGWMTQMDAVLDAVNSGESCVMYGSNFSIGMQMFNLIVARAAQLMQNAADYDVMLHELHHKRKADSPSGTAITLANTILESLTRKTSMLTETSHGRIADSQLHVSSTRGGEITGTHTVYCDSFSDTIELTHRAKNRSGFALGAVLAAEFIPGKKGYLDFADVFEDVLSYTSGVR